MRSLRPLLLLALLPLALGTGPASCGGVGPAAPAPEFDADRAWALLEHQVALGPRPAGSEALEATRRWIAAELRSAGLEPVREDFVAKVPVTELNPHRELAMANVWADLAGTPSPDGAPPEIVILGSHFDTKLFPFPFVGANDGGSSTAVLLELARVLAAGGPRPVTYRFLFIDGEEAIREHWADPDNRYGSRHHVAGLEASGLDERVRCFVLLDLVGDRDLRILRETTSDPRLLALVEEAAHEIELGKHVGGARQVAYDDHQIFMAAGIPAVDLIDLRYGPNNSWWHSPEDTLDKCSKASLDAIGRIVLQALPKIERDFRRRR